jgi:hypothetical protein
LAVHAQSETSGFMRTSMAGRTRRLLAAGAVGFVYSSAIRPKGNGEGTSTTLVLASALGGFARVSFDAAPVLPEEKWPIRPSGWPNTSSILRRCNHSDGQPWSLDWVSGGMLIVLFVTEECIARSGRLADISTSNPHVRDKHAYTLWFASATRCGHIP